MEHRHKNRQHPKPPRNKIAKYSNKSILKIDPSHNNPRKRSYTLLPIIAAVVCILGCMMIPCIIWIQKADPQAPAGGRKRREIFATTLSFKGSDGMFWMWLNDGSVSYLSAEQNEQLHQWAKSKKSLKEIRALAQAQF